MKKFLIAPSILSADFSRLGEDITKVINAGGDIIHFDVMDNFYVPNLTMGPIILDSLKKYGISAPIDVHLMTRSIDDLIPKFAQAGADSISFHPETSFHIDRSLQIIKEYGCKAGIVLNPATNLNFLEYIMDKIDIILLMGVNPGFGGQTFIPSILKKIKNTRKLIDNSKYKILLAIDGGININNISEIASAGADILIIGSSIFNGNKNYKNTIDSMRSKLKKFSDYSFH